jgi:hypothetical protein
MVVEFESPSRAFDKTRSADAQTFPPSRSSLRSAPQQQRNDRGTPLVQIVQELIHPATKAGATSRSPACDNKWLILVSPSGGRHLHPRERGDVIWNV